MTTIFPYGLPEDWNQYDEGDAAIYSTPPALVPASMAPRVIYELRQDVQRLNDEVLTLRDERRPAVHHIYMEDDYLHMWDAHRRVVATATSVYVYQDDLCVLRFKSPTPEADARWLANTIFQTNKEWAS